MLELVREKAIVSPWTAGFVLSVGMILAGCGEPRPELEVSYPVESDTVRAPGPITVSASPTDTILAVEFRADGVPWAVDHDPPFEATLDPTGFERGVVRVEVRATMVDGRIGTDTRRLRLSKAGSDSQSRPPPAQDGGPYPKHSKVEIHLNGPDSRGMSADSNPFALEVLVRFGGPEGEYVAPAFYAGDGHGSLNGRLWKVRFAPDAEGTWTWQTESPDPTLNGQSGSFQVVEADAGAGAFATRGRLQWAPGPYLRFQNGDWWIKGGADDPEDFLGNPNLPTLDDRLRAVEFLADAGINSLYVMTMNIGGDHRNVWPWVGGSEESAKLNHRHFDVVRLAQWEAIFAHMQKHGVAIHLVLEDDEAWTDFDRELYYREMVARFGHHNALIWNLVEEYQDNYSADETRRMAALLSGLDPYDHPIAVHHLSGLDTWMPFLGDPNIDITSFQTEPEPQNASAAEWFDRSRTAARRIPISFDETGRLATSDRALARHITWSVYLGGANFELHTWPIYQGQYTFEDYRDMFEDVARARRLIEAQPRYWEMESRNDLLRAPTTTAYLLADEGRTYIAYAVEPTPLSIDLTASGAAFEATWYDPATGEARSAGTVQGGEVRTLEDPPFADDVVLVLQRSRRAQPTVDS